jgi:hypothetical protein
MKRALIGLSNNVSVNFNKVKIWANSFKKHSVGDVVLLCANASVEDLQLCQEHNIIAVPVTIEDTWYINHKRLEHTAEYLKTASYDVVLISDVFDVLFQRDPFEQLDLVTFDIFVSGEGVKVSQEPWNSDNINKIFPENYLKCKEVEVINSGVIAGKPIALCQLYQKLFQLCEEGSKDHNIKDQAALIVMVANNSIERLKIFNLDDAWAVHCAVAGPTQFFQGWGFKDNIKYGIPRMLNEAIVNKDNIKYSIVHQFNRVPSWKEILERKVNE